MKTTNFMQWQHVPMQLQQRRNTGEPTSGWEGDEEGWEEEEEEKALLSSLCCSCVDRLWLRL